MKFKEFIVKAASVTATVLTFGKMGAAITTTEADDRFIGKLDSGLLAVTDLVASAGKIQQRFADKGLTKDDAANLAGADLAQAFIRANQLAGRKLSGGKEAELTAACVAMARGAYDSAVCFED